MSRRRMGGGIGEKSRTSMSAQKRKVQYAVEKAEKKGLSRLAIHMVERAAIAKREGESGDHWRERQLHKQYDEGGRKRVQGVIGEIQDAGLWPW